MRKKQSFLGTLIFATILFVGGLMAYQHLTKPIAREAEASKKWPTVQGSVISSKLSLRKDNEGKTMYAPDINYTYSVDGKEYTGTNIRTIDGSTSMKQSVKKQLEKYAKGTSVKVYYDPEFPDSAVLEPGTGFLFGILLKLPLLFYIVSILMVLGYIKRILIGH